jgi:hypothetical protein
MPEQRNELAVQTQPREDRPVQSFPNEAQRKALVAQAQARPPLLLD